MNRRNFLTLSALAPLVPNILLGSTDNINKYYSTNNDIYLLPHEFKTLKILNKRIKNLKRYVGYANFNIISFQDALFYGRNYSSVGAFSKDEINLIEKLFYENPLKYGFYGNKTCENLNNKISRRNIIKIPHTGHFLFKGKPHEDYNRLKDDVGHKLILTSGIRNIMKQLSLYCAKIQRLHGNVTLASHSIAPPAYSYHTTSDFDVGRKGWGYKNFTSKFATTKEFRKIKKLHYVSMRYTVNNKEGVRYEPWHIKVI